VLEFYSGAAGPSGRFTEGFSLRRLHYRTEIVARQLRMLGNRASATKAEASDDIPF